MFFYNKKIIQKNNTKNNIVKQTNKDIISKTSPVLLRNKPYVDMNDKVI